MHRSKIKGVIAKINTRKLSLKRYMKLEEYISSFTQNERYSMVSGHQYIEHLSDSSLEINS